MSSGLENLETVSSNILKAHMRYCETPSPILPKSFLMRGEHFSWHSLSFSPLRAASSQCQGKSRAESLALLDQMCVSDSLELKQDVFRVVGMGNPGFGPLRVLDFSPRSFTPCLV